MIRDLKNELIKQIADILELDAEKIHPEQTLEELEVDSIIFILFVVMCETSFGLQFEDEMLLLSKFETIGDFMAYVQRRYDLVEDDKSDG